MDVGVFYKLDKQFSVASLLRANLSEIGRRSGTAKDFSISENIEFTDAFFAVLRLCYLFIYLNNEELRSLYFAPDILKMMKSRTGRWMGHQKCAKNVSLED